MDGSASDSRLRAVRSKVALPTLRKLPLPPVSLTKQLRLPFWHTAEKGVDFLLPLRSQPIQIFL